MRVRSSDLSFRRTMRRRLAAALVIPFVLAAQGRAHADGSATENTQRAQALFDEGLSLIAGGRYDAACPKFEESQRLEPALGTQFNIADCYARTGRLASGWALFHEIARAAEKAGKSERAQTATARADALAPRLPKLRILVPRRVPGLVIKRDDVVVAAEDWERLAPIDLGSHTLSASAAGHRAWRTTIAIETEGKTTELSIPALAKDEVAPPPAVEQEQWAPQRTWALVAGGAGIAAVAVGSVFGVIALQKHDEAVAACNSSDPKACQPAMGSDPASTWNDATSAGTMSTISFVVAGVMLATGTVLWFTAPHGAKNHARAPAGLLTW